MLLSVSVEASMLLGVASIALRSCRVTNVFRTLPTNCFGVVYLIRTLLLARHIRNWYP
jgi:hypothetical protein